MKRLKAILVLIAMSLTSFSAIASDTAVDGIYYDFDSENKTARVTYRGYSYDSYSKEYTGDVVIPAKVTYEGVEKPPYAERHVRWCERSENESRKKTTSFYSYSIRLVMYFLICK